MRFYKCMRPNRRWRKCRGADHLRPSLAERFERSKGRFECVGSRRGLIRRVEAREKYGVAGEYSGQDAIDADRR